MHDPALPLLGFTVGDAAGVGPELLLRSHAVHVAFARVVVYADLRWLEAARHDLLTRGVCDVLPRVRRVEDASAAGTDRDVLSVVDVGGSLDAGVLRPPEVGAPYPWGRAVPGFGCLQHEALLRAVADARRGALDAIVTAPWHKKRLADDGLPATGHTEVLQRASGAEDVLMVLAGERLRVGLVTTHLPLARVAEAVTGAAVERAARLLDRGLRELWGIERPRIAVCGLNPHAGEEGAMGHEEIEIIAPALGRLRAAGIEVDGPWPADTLFPRVVAGSQPADAVLAMYHDQGLGPLKTACFSKAANITVGLPFVRTSVDHGTAYDIAGTGRASTTSLTWAAQTACRFVLASATHPASGR